MTDIVEDAFTVPVTADASTGSVSGSRSRSARTVVGTGTKANSTVILAYNAHDRRLKNIREGIARHEAALGLARNSGFASAESRGTLLRLSRRLHKAREELSAFESEATAAK